MADLITQIDQLTPERLTLLLKRTGRLTHGKVTSLRFTSVGESDVSLRYRLQIETSEDTQGNTQGVNVPRSLFLRLSNPAFAHNNEQIADFYSRLVPIMQASNWQGAWPIADCLEVVWSPTLKTDHLLLEDLRDTHFIAENNQPPSYQHAEQLMDSFASVHAFWWQHPLLGQQIGKLLTPEIIDSSETNYRQQIEQIKASYHTDLSTEQYAILCQPDFVWPKQRRDRMLQGHALTIVHRDPHPGNLFYPRDRTTHSVKLVDWQSWRVDPATDDLAYQIAFHWPLSTRRAWEETLLRHYHQRLIERGVAAYTWDDLLFDYRSSIIRFIMIMVLYWRHPPNRDRLKLGLQAFEDWQCAKLLGS